MGGGASHALHKDNVLKDCSPEQLNTANSFMKCFVYSLNDLATTSSNLIERPPMSDETSDALASCISSFENLLKVCGLEASDRPTAAKLLGIATVLAAERTCLAAKSGDTVFKSLESKDPAKENFSVSHSSKIVAPMIAASSKNNASENLDIGISELPSWCNPNDFKLFDMLRNVTDDGKHFQSKLLIDKDIFVLDSSILETSMTMNPTQLAIADKHNILSAINQTGIRDCIIASYGALPTATEDAWLQELHDRSMLTNSATSYLYGMTELYEGVDDLNWPITDKDPVGLIKMKQFGVQNAVICFSVTDSVVRWEDEGGSCPVSVFADLIKARISEMKRISNESRVFINFRDGPTAFKSVLYAYRLIQLTKYLALMPIDLRPVGILLEDSTGNLFPWEFSNLCNVLNNTMTSSGWTDGHLLVHVHKKYGLAEACVQSALVNGATGIWGGITDDGPACGSAGSLVTLANISRIGNEYVKREFNFEKLFVVGKLISTVKGDSTAGRQELVSRRALEIFVSEGGIQYPSSFDFFAHVGAPAPVSVDHTLAAAVIRDKFAQTFQLTSADFNLDVCKRIKTAMRDSSSGGNRRRYSSPSAFLELYVAAGGSDHLAAMQAVVQAQASALNFPDDHPALLVLRSRFDAFSGVKSNASGPHNEYLSHLTFYHAFLSGHVVSTSADQLTLYCEVVDASVAGYVSWDGVASLAKKWLSEHANENAQYSETATLEKFVEQKIIPAAYQEMVARKHEGLNK